MSELDRIELRLQVLELAAMAAEDGADFGRVKFIAQQFWSWVVALDESEGAEVPATHVRR